MQTEINRLNAAINTLNEANQTAEMMLTTLNAELNTLREQSSTINHHLTEATEALHLTEERLAETIHQFDTLRHSLSTNEANHQTEITRLQNELERAAPNETQDNQMLQQELNTVTERYQEATRMLRIYAETLRGTQRQMNTQNPEGETSNDEQRNSATTNSL
jgi:chromosome segregation ATPase